MESKPSAHREVRIVEGDLLDQPVDAIVNAWNRNVIPGGCCCRRAFPGRSSVAVACSISGSGTPRTDTAGGCRVDIGGSTSLSRHRACGGDQPVVARLGTVDPGFRPKRVCGGCGSGVSVPCLPAAGGRIGWFSGRQSSRNPRRRTAKRAAGPRNRRCRLQTWGPRPPIACTTYGEPTFASPCVLIPIPYVVAPPVDFTPLRILRNLGRTRQIVAVLLNHGSATLSTAWG